MSRRLLLLAGVLALATALPSPRSAHGQGAYVLMNDRNHPELQWQELRTEHFRIFYHDPLEPWARDAATILERFHRPLCRRLDVKPRERTRVYLSDQDQIANGAAVSWDYFYVWVPSHASYRSFAGARSWFEEVLIHEYAHILVSEASRTWLGNLAFPLGLYPPRWLHEGIAQWVAEPWSVLRGDRTFAAALLDGSIDRNPPGVPGGGALVHYARGHARVRWLSVAYGDSVLPKLIRPSGPLGLYRYRSAEKRALGRDGSEWTDRFRREMIAFYGERFRRGEPPDSLGAPLPSGLAYPTHVTEGGDSIHWWVGQGGRGAAESSLFRRRGLHAPERIVAGSVSGTPAVLGDGRTVLPRMHRGPYGSWIEDLAIWDPVTERTRFLTSGERISEPGLLAGDRLVALADSPLGPSLVQAPLPGEAGPCVFEILHRWPRGWIAHDLAPSPDGSRLVVSTTRPDGRRDLWGFVVGQIDADSVRLTRTSEEVRDTAWLDTETIAWTSHDGGLSNIRSASWPYGGGLDSTQPRTALGTAAEVGGIVGDSLIVLDRTSRKKTATRRIDPGRRPLRSSSQPVYPFPAGPAVDPDRREPRIEGPLPYDPLNETRPWIRLPLLGPQGGSIGIGYGELWAEPLLRHAWGGYVYGGADQVSDPDRGFFYLTTTWGPWVTAFHSSSIVPRRVLHGSVLFERREITGLALLSPLEVPSDPNLSAWIDAFVKTDSRRPRFGGRGLRTPTGAPRSWSSLQVGGGFGLVRVPSHGRSAIGPVAGWGTNVRLQAGLAPWSASTRFLRGSLDGFHARPLALPLPASLWIDLGVKGASGGLPPQEFVGLDADGSHRILPGWPGLDGTVFLRGWPSARAARFVLHANIEARMRILPDLGFRGPGIGIHGGSIAPFLEAAHPWGGRSAGFLDERMRIAVGIEGRFAARIGPIPVVPAVAWGHPIGRDGPPGSWSWRLTTALPFSIPLQPPALLRRLLGGAFLADSWGGGNGLAEGSSAGPGDLHTR